MENVFLHSKNYIVFDIETTGLSAAKDRITEIGAVRIKNGKITDSFNELVNPQMHIHWRITRLTGITNDMVIDKKTISGVLPSFLDFCEGATVVAHNANFDVSFIKQNAKKLGLEFRNEVLDTLSLARKILPRLDNHRLDTVAKNLGIKILRSHRAKDDALATAKIFLRFTEMLQAK